MAELASSHHFRGNRFRVGLGGYRIFSLGYDEHLHLGSPRAVVLFDENHNVVAQARIGKKDPIKWQHHWQCIDPVDLLPGMTYLLAAFIAKGTPLESGEGACAKISPGLEDLGSWVADANGVESRHAWKADHGTRNYVANMCGACTSPLSARHQELIDLAAQGLTDEEIAAKLGIGVQTIDTYWKRLRGIFNVNNRAGVVAGALHASYRQSHQDLVLEREELVRRSERLRREADEARQGELIARSELSHIRIENTRLTAENSLLRAALDAVERSGLIVYDEQTRECSDNIAQLGINPGWFRSGEDSITARIKPEDIPCAQGNARIRSFRVVDDNEASHWVLEIRDGGTTACAVLLDRLGDIETADREQFLAYVSDSALAMVRTRRSSQTLVLADFASALPPEVPR